MRALLTKISVALVAYGPVGVLLLALMDSLGLPLPAVLDLLLLDVAVHSTHTPGRAYFTALLALVGSLAGNIALFQGARHGRRLFSRKEPAPGERRRFQEWFHRYGLLTVFVPAVVPFVPLPLKVFVISAGALHTHFRRFTAVVLLARVIRYFGMAWLALQLGADAHGFLVHNAWAMVGVALAVALATYGVIYWNDRRRQSADPSL
jgi:membrane protein DedA with SNARE-associated domain